MTSERNGSKPRGESGTLSALLVCSVSAAVLVPIHGGRTIDAVMDDHPAIILATAVASIRFQFKPGTWVSIEGPDSLWNADLYGDESGVGGWQHGMGQKGRFGIATATPCQMLFQEKPGSTTQYLAKEEIRGGTRTMIYGSSNCR